MYICEYVNHCTLYHLLRFVRCHNKDIHSFIHSFIPTLQNDTFLMVFTGGIWEQHRRKNCYFHADLHFTVHIPFVT